MVLQNRRREIFCQGLAQGKSIAQAYRDAGYRYTSADAARSNRLPVVIQRVAEIRASREGHEKKVMAIATEKVSVDKAWVLARLIENATNAARLEDFAPSNRALELVGRELGMFIERRELGAPGDFAQLDSVDDVMTAVRKELGQAAAAVLSGMLAAPLATDPKTIEHCDNPPQANPWRPGARRSTRASESLDVVSTDSEPDSGEC